MTTQVSGPLTDITDMAVDVEKIIIRATNSRVHGDGLLLDWEREISVEDGVVSFPALPGPILISLVSPHRRYPEIKGIVPEGDTATLREVVESTIPYTPEQMGAFRELVVRAEEAAANAERDAESAGNSQSSASGFAGAAANSAGVAGTHARDAAADRKQTGEDRVQTGQDRAATEEAKDLAIRTVDGKVDRDELGEAVGLVSGWAADAIGGRNLFQNGDFSLGPEAGSWIKVIDIQTDEDGTRYGSERYGWGLEYEMDISPGVYTLSFDARDRHAPSSSRVRLSLTSRDEEGNVIPTNSTATLWRLTDTFQRYSSTITIAEDVVQLGGYFLNSNANPGNTEIDFTNIKLEKGSVATPWTLAPEDAALNYSAGIESPNPIVPLDHNLHLRLDASVGTRIFAGDTVISSDTGWVDFTHLADPTRWNNVPSSVNFIRLRRKDEVIYVHIQINRTSGGSWQTLIDAGQVFKEPPGFNVSEHRAMLNANIGGKSATVDRSWQVGGSLICVVSKYESDPWQEGDRVIINGTVPAYDDWPAAL